MTFVPLITVETELGKMVTEASENLWTFLRVRMDADGDNSWQTNDIPQFVASFFKNAKPFQVPMSHRGRKVVHVRPIFPTGGSGFYFMFFYGHLVFLRSFVSEPNTTVPPFATFVLVAFAGCPGECVNHCKSKKLEFELIWWKTYFVRMALAT